MTARARRGTVYSKVTNVKRLILLACALLLPSLASAQIAPFPAGVTPPVFGMPASAVNGGGTFSPQLYGPQSCTVPAYSLTGAPTNGWGGTSTSVCGVIGSTAIFTGTSTTFTSTVPILAPNGSAAVPGNGYSAEAGLGWNRVGTQLFAATVNSGYRVAIAPTVFNFEAAVCLGWTSGDPTLVAADTVLCRGAANRLDVASGDSVYIISGGLGVGVTPPAAGVGQFNTSVIAPLVNATTGLQINGAATAGNTLIGNGTNFVSLARALTTALPADQTGNATATFKMNGLGAAGAPCTVTPTATGRVTFFISGTVFNATAIADGATYKIAYGTGAAPANAAAATGTVISAPAKYIAATTAEKAPFAIQASVTGLALNTAHWFDLQLADITAGTASIADVTCTAMEQ